MTDQYTQNVKQINQMQQAIQKKALKRVFQLLTEYYQSINQQVSKEDLKKETFRIVKDMNQIAISDARDEADYNALMDNQFNLYRQNLANKQKASLEAKTETDPIMMATVMISSLQKLQDFMDRTELQPHDFQLIQQLIQFIKSIPSDNFGVHITQQDQIDAIKVYYEKLFLPIQKTIKNQQTANPAMQAQQAQMAATPQQQQQQQHMMQQGMQPMVQQQQQQQMMQQQQQQMQQLPQIAPSMSQQQMPSPSQDMMAIPRQMPVPTPQNQMPKALQPQQSQGQMQLGLPAPLQAQQSQQQMQQIKQQQSAQQLQQKAQQLQNPRSPQPRASHQMAATPPQMMQQQQQQQMHGMNVQANQMMQQPQAAASQIPMQGRQQTPGDNLEFIKQLFQNVRCDCAVFYTTPHPPHF